MEKRPFFSAEWNLVFSLWAGHLFQCVESLSVRCAAGSSVHARYARYFKDFGLLFWWKHFHTGGSIFTPFPTMWVGAEKLSLTLPRPGIQPRVLGLEFRLTTALRPLTPHHFMWEMVFTSAGVDILTAGVWVGAGGTTFHAPHVRSGIYISLCRHSNTVCVWVGAGGTTFDTLDVRSGI